MPLKQRSCECTRGKHANRGVDRRRPPRPRGLGLKFALENAGDIEVTGEAGSGAEALAQARLRPPDVVLLDYGLPDMSGAEVATALHEGGRRPGSGLQRLRR